MTAQELATAARYRLRVIALVHNDSTYGAIKNIQDRNHDGRYLDVELNNPDFLELALPTASRAAARQSRRARSRPCAKHSIATALADRSAGRVALSARRRQPRSRRSVGIAADRLAVGPIAQQPVHPRVDRLFQ